MVKRIEWTPEMDAVIRERYSVEGCMGVARLLDQPHSNVYRRAIKLGVPLPGHRVPPGGHGARLLELSKRPDGVRRSDCADLKNDQFYKAAAALIRAGKIIKFQISLRNCRWFDTEANAQAWATRTGTTKRAPSPAKPRATAAKGTHPTVRVPHWGGPARMPGEPVITERTKVTIAPPPPQRLLRTNTYGPG